LFDLAINDFRLLGNGKSTNTTTHLRSESQNSPIIKQLCERKELVLIIQAGVTIRVQMASVRRNRSPHIIILQHCVLEIVHHLPKWRLQCIQQADPCYPGWRQREVIARQRHHFTYARI
jgi:hypothetical protein